jgi:hypothetical protein
MKKKLRIFRLDLKLNLKKLGKKNNNLILNEYTKKSSFNLFIWFILFLFIEMK